MGIFVVTLLSVVMLTLAVLLLARWYGTQVITYCLGVRNFDNEISSILLQASTLGWTFWGATYIAVVVLEVIPIAMMLTVVSH